MNRKPAPAPTTTLQTLLALGNPALSQQTVARAEFATRGEKLQIALHLLLLFFAALPCHSQLAEDRPPAAQLTEFYLWLSIGGALGGVFNSLIAPVVFNGIAEYPLAIVLALLLRPRSRKQAGNWWDVGAPICLGALTAALV